MKELAAGAVLTHVKKGSTIVDTGHVVRQMAIIKSGTVAAVVESDHHHGGHQSAEAAVASSTMAERMLRKQNFLAQLQRKEKSTTTASLFVGGTLQNLKPDLHPGGRVQPRQGFANKNRRSHATGELEPSSPPADEVAEGPSTVAETTLTAGDSFGELSILERLTGRLLALHDRPPALLSLLQSERGKRFKEFIELLEEVHILSPLLYSERFELACNAIGLVDFPPGERVLNQGLVRSAKLWYVIHSGAAVVSLDTEKDGKKERMSS
ncbi:unnamed protein product [Effrenium voratum]|uniref:Cyclic nucleotide-binding domain-containing protein n=1 Tax=Effrenium voratum TaxID=2562239 RepID=A0AA36JSJ9_9DINO|nr:unnamed protein product [Effrenium voratum]